MKSSDGKSQRRAEKKKEDQKRESLRRKKIQVREKVGKSRNTAFFQWFVKAAGAEPAGQMRDEKLHAVVARSTFRSQNVQNTSASSWDVEKFTPLWREAHFEVKSGKTEGFGALLDVQISFCVAGARDCAPCQKWAKREGFVAFPKTMAGVGHLKRICKDAFSAAGAVQETCSTRDMFIRAVRRSGRWFPERGCILEHRIFRFAEMILRDRCSTSYDPYYFFVAGAVV